MSFLNSVLNSIDGSSGPIQAPQIRRLASSGKLKETQQSTTSGGKRKAEDDLQSPDEKVSKRTSISSPKIIPTDKKATKTPQTLKNKSSEPASAYKGTGRLEVAKAAAEPSKVAPPKKGSFAEILARAKQNQGPPVGTITHKPKEKVSAKKEIAMEKELAKKNPTKSVPSKGGLAKKTSELAIRKAGTETKAGEKGAKPGGYQGTSRPMNKPKPQPAAGYQGTAKAKPTSTYQGTVKGSKAAPPKRGYHSDSEPSRSKLQSSSKHRRKEEYSDEDSEGYDSEDKYTYASEDYSDMDAGFDDLEEEDEMAQRLARQEDAKEQAQLDRLKREKEKKKALLTSGKSKGRN